MAKTILKIIGLFVAMYIAYIAGYVDIFNLKEMFKKCYNIR